MAKPKIDILYKKDLVATPLIGEVILPSDWSVMQSEDNVNISGNDIKDDTITADNIEEATITAAEIANATITGTQIANATITATNITAATITATEIANLTITAGKIANATITATQIANATITTTQISGTAAITGTQIANATITGSNIGATTIEAANIANATITATQIANTTITATQIANATITGTQIAATTIAAGNIVNATITGTQIAATTIEAANIANATITGTQIAATTIAAGNITNATITATQISNSAGITGTQIANATIIGTNISAGANIAGSQLAAAAGITGGQIANTTITGGNITNNTITVGKTSLPTHFISGTFTDNSPSAGYVAWSDVKVDYNGTTYSITNGNTNSKYIWWDYSLSTTTFQVAAALPTLVNEDVLVATNISGTHRLIWNATDVNGDQIQLAAITGSLIAGTTITGSNIANNTIQAGQIAAATITGSEIANTTIAGGNLINNTITATQITNATITGTQIAATTIAAGNIVNNTITATQITNATITGTQIAATTVAAGNIVNATITATQIANATITTTQISGTAAITGTQIATATITGTQIANTTIAAGNIVNATITATEIANLTITAGKIANATITATQIAASTITATEINVSSLSSLAANLGTITAGNITLNTTGYIKGGQTAFDTGNGFFLGYATDKYKFSVGDSANNSFVWNGSNVIVNGIMNVLNTLQLKIYEIADLPTPSTTNTGVKNPGTMANSAAVGTIAWSNPDNAKVSNGSYATAVNPSSYAWDISTAKSLRSAGLTTTKSITGLFFKSDGTKMYTCGYADETVREYALSTAWNITTASYVRNFSIAAKTSTPQGLSFKADGTKMYVVGFLENDIFEYTLSTAWNISTATYSQVLDLSAQATYAQALFFKEDGTKMYFCTYDSSSMKEYTLSSAWDISTATYDRTLDISAKDSNPMGIHFKSDGTKMFFVGDSSNKVYEYALSTAYNLSTATYTRSLSLSSEAYTGIFFKPDGFKMYISEIYNDHIYEWDISSVLTNYLKATNFGFSIASGTAIAGIKIEIEKKQSAAVSTRDNAIKIVKADGTVGTINKASDDQWAESDTYDTYGASTNLWGLGWTAEDLNDVDFGVVLAADISQGVTASVDHIRVTVYFPDPASPVHTGSIAYAINGRANSQEGAGEGTGTTVIYNGTIWRTSWSGLEVSA